MQQPSFRSAALLISTILLLLPVAAGAQTAGLDAAIDRLTVEAKSLVEPESPSAAVLEQPHPAVRSIALSDVAAVLDRIEKPFTGDNLADAYIRWHLLYVVRSHLDQSLEDFRATGEAKPDERAAPVLVGLLRTLPESPDYKWQSSYRQEPAEVANRIRQLRDQTAVEVGYPPFNRTYRGDDALPFVDAARQREIERILKEIEALRKQLRRVNDPAIELRNRKASDLNRVVRNYRSALIEAVVRTGDASTLRAAGSEIDRLVRRQQRSGFDLLASVYLAAFDGALALYEPAALERLRQQLQATARSSDGYVEVMQGDTKVDPWIVPRERSFDDYSFHMRQMLTSPDTVQRLAGRFGAAVRDVPTKPREPVTPERLTIHDIRGAIQRAVAVLNDPPADESDSDLATLTPAIAMRSDYDLWLIHSGRQRPTVRQAMRHEYGNHAAINWALLSAGQSYQDPRLFRRVNWILAADTPYVYDRSMRVLMTTQLAMGQFQPYVQRDVQWLLQAMTDRGGFGFQHLGGRAEGWGDHANAQYAVLALAAAQEAGVESPQKAWQLIDRHWRLSQETVKGSGPAGWALGMLGQAQQDAEGDAKPRRNAPQATVSAPMTAAGIASLAATERILGSSRDGYSRELAAGLAWLDANFSLSEQDEATDWYYYMWTIQRVGHASGYARFNGVDWFRHVTAEMVNRQDPRGFWDDPDDRVGPGPSSAFALLYLGSALDPVGISKVRYAGAWNDRPADLWNFVEYASDSYEHRTTWRIVDADQPVYELIESPLLYLSVGEQFSLSDEQVAGLRAYIDAGGLLVINPDKALAPVTQSINELIARITPGRAAEPLDRDDPLYSIHRQVRPSVQMRAVRNGIRPLIIAVVRDVGQDLQRNERLTSDSFATLSNVYLYSVGKNPRRTRLESSYIAPSQAPVTRTVTAARVKHDGDYDPEPAALQQLARLMQQDHAVDLSVAAMDAGELDERVRLAFLTTTGMAALSDEQAAALRAWLASGGTLWLDAAGGTQTAAEGASALLRQLAPQSVPGPVPLDAPLLTGRGLGATAHDITSVRYRLYALQRMTPTIRPRLQVVSVGERGRILFSLEDVTAAWAGLEHWGILGYDVTSARQLAANSILEILQNPR